MTPPSKGLQITPIKDARGNVISFTVSGGRNLKELLDKFIEANCEHDWQMVQGIHSTGFQCSKCGEVDFD